MTIQARFQVIFGVLLGAMALVSVFNIWAIGTVERLSQTEDRRFASYLLADEIRQSSDDLTRMARSFAATRDGRFRTYFQDILDIRAGEIPYPDGYSGIFWDFVIAKNRRLRHDGTSISLQDRMRKLGFNEAEFAKLRVAEQNSNDLVNLEEVAMNAVVGQFKDNGGDFTVLGPPDQRLALGLLFGEDYHVAKAKIMQPIQEFFQLLDARTMSQTTAIRDEHYRSQLIAVISILLTFTLGGWAFYSLRSSVIGPMAELREAIEEFRVTRTAIDVPHATRNDEIGAIARGFQAAAQEVTIYINEINNTREELERGQKEILDREGRIRALLDISPIGFTLNRPDGEVLMVNDALLEMSGRSLDEYKASRAVGLYRNAKDRERFIQTLTLDRSVSDFEVEMLRSDGTNIWASLNSRIIDHDGTEAFMTWASDITARKTSEIETQESEAKIRELLDSSPIGITVVDDATKERLFINRRLVEILGATSADELSPEAIAESFADPDQMKRIYQTIADGGVVENEEVLRRRLDGATFWSLISQSVIRGFQGRDARVVWVVDIDERKRIEAEVAENEKRVRSILESSPAGISITAHSTGERLYANARFNEMLTGDSDSSVVTMDIADSFENPDDLDEIRQILIDQSYSHEAEVLRKRLDGTTWWCSHSWRPINLWGDDAFICWHFDISDRKKAEERVNEILDNSPVGVSIVSHDTGKRLYTNPRFNELFSGDPNISLAGARVVDTFVNPEELEEIRRVTLESEFFHDAEVHRKRLDGAKWWCLQSWRPVNSWGERVHMVWHYDITLRKQIEEKIKENESILTTILDNMPAIVFLKDLEGHFIRVNRRYQDQYGPDRHTIAGKTLYDFLPKALADRLTVFDKQTIESGGHFEQEQTLIDNEGRESILRTQLFPVLNDSGKITAFGGVETDITAIREAEAKLQDAFSVISSSIDYASRIQRSVLPDQDMLSAVVKDHFVLWEPRDVVGGDLYWVGAWGNGCLILLGDCTGHGVPGAFMTLISIGALERAMTEVEGGDVGNLITRMHQYIQATLSQHYEGGDSDDGIELGACYFEPDQPQMTFVGARFELFIAEGAEVTSVKGTKKGLGYRGISYSQQYDETIVELNSAQRFFLTTDGLVDQVGGERRRGFGKKRLRSLLRENHEKPMKDQKEAIYQALLEHQGDEIRRDDVAVIGFRL